jgi:hypothetical protein
VTDSVRNGKSYSHQMGWKDSNCAYITDPEHLSDILLDNGDEFHVLLPIDHEFWMSFIDCFESMGSREKVSINVVRQ